MPRDSPEFYDLLFHAAFAKRIFDIIRREGKSTQGFDRMQQSFMDAVEKIKAILAPYENEAGIKDGDSTTLSGKKLSGLIEDLALMKNWLMSHNAP